MQIQNQGGCNSTNIAGQFKGGTISGEFWLQENISLTINRCTYMKPYLETQNSNQNSALKNLWSPSTPWPSAGVPVGSEQTLQVGESGWWLSYGLLSFPHSILIIWASQMQPCDATNYPYTNIDLIDWLCSYGIVLFYPVYQMVRSELLSFLTSACWEC